MKERKKRGKEAIKREGRDDRQKEERRTGIK